MAEAPRDQNFVPTALFESSTSPGTTYPGQIITATGRIKVDAAGGGTVSSVSVVSANGFAGTVATATTTPAITLSTTINSPVLAGNGTAIIAATTTGSGSTVVLNNTPTLITPILGVATATTLGVGAITSTGALAVTVTTGTIATFKTTQDTTSTVGLVLEGDRATPTNGDDIALRYVLSDSAGNQDTMAEIRAQINSVTSGAESSQLEFAVVTGGTLGTEMLLTSTNLTPAGNDGNALGSATVSWADLFLASGGVVNFNNGNMTLTHAAGSLTFAGGNVLGLGAATATSINGNVFTTGSSTYTGTAAQTYTFPTTTATIARTDAAQTFTGAQTYSNAVIYTNNAIAASGNAATVPVTAKLNTVTNNSAATLTITMTTASAVDGQMTIVRILDASAAAQTITWVNTENSTITAPTTSNGSTTLFLTVGFIYNGATSKWRCIASA